MEGMQQQHYHPTTQPNMQFRCNAVKAVMLTSNSFEFSSTLGLATDMSSQ
jgi:hypothetical protein